LFTLNNLSDLATVDVIAPVTLLNVASPITEAEPSSLPLPSNFCTVSKLLLKLVFKFAASRVAVAPTVDVQCTLASVPSLFTVAGAISFIIVAILVFSVPLVPTQDLGRF
jgi:hypothetical protein